MQDWDVVSGVGLTALAVAAARAVDSSRMTPLVRDPYAASFVEAVPDAPIPLPVRGEDVPWDDKVWDRMSLFVGLRSRFFDEYLAEAWSAGVRQVVILAAGLDSRAYRLDWPEDSTLFEVDQRQVLEFKDEVLSGEAAQPRCDRRPVPADLRGDWAVALTERGFDAGVPTAWLIEGLFAYLTSDAARRLLETVRELSATDSTIAIGYVAEASDVRRDPAVRNVLDKFGFDYTELLPADMAGDPTEQLDGAGWAVGSVSGEDLAKRYSRDVGDQADSMFGANGRFLTGRLR